MTTEVLIKIIEDLQRGAEEILDDKAREYTDGKDRLHNFKTIGNMLGIDPAMVAMVYAYKHFSSITSYLRRRETATEEPLPLTEPLKGRFQDLLNYTKLLWAIIEEESPPTTTFAWDHSVDAKEPVTVYEQG